MIKREVMEPRVKQLEDLMAPEIEKLRKLVENALPEQIEKYEKEHADWKVARVEWERIRPASSSSGGDTSVQQQDKSRNENNARSMSLTPVGSDAETSTVTAQTDKEDQGRKFTSSILFLLLLILLTD